MAEKTTTSRSRKSGTTKTEQKPAEEVNEQESEATAQQDQPDPGAGDGAQPDQADQPGQDGGDDDQPQEAPASDLTSFITGTPNEDAQPARQASSAPAVKATGRVVHAAAEGDERALVVTSGYALTLAGGRRGMARQGDVVIGSRELIDRGVKLGALQEQREQ